MRKCRCVSDVGTKCNSHSKHGIRTKNPCFPAVSLVFFLCFYIFNFFTYIHLHTYTN